MTSHELARALLEEQDCAIQAYDPDTEVNENVTGIIVDTEAKIITICTDD